MTIEAAIFDIGGVLLTWEPVAAVVPPYTLDEWHQFVKEVGWQEFNLQQDAGRSLVEARAWLAHHHPQWEPLFVQYIKNFQHSITGQIPGTGQILGDLQAVGIKLYGLTNWPAEFFFYAPIAHPALTLCEDIIVSGEVKLAKPDPAIFQLCIERFSLHPGRTVFIDDNLPNVTAAAAQGFHALHFTNASKLRYDLKALGVELAGDDC